MPRVLLPILALLLQTLVAGAAFVPSTQERELAALFRSDPNQQRPTKVYDETLSRVARKKAKDMAARGYFSHVNPDGKAANFLVQAAGYHLPVWWPDDPKLNYLESLSAGYASAKETWNSWLQSGPHRTHVLGLTDFFRSQVRYGIGYAKGGSYGHYWVIITAPHPWLEITSPGNPPLVNGSTLTLEGKTSADSETARVVVRLENSAGTTPFQTASGTATWSTTLTDLVPGENTVRVRSLDSEGATICESVLKVQSLSPLNVSAGTGGTLSPANLNGTTYHKIGSSITLEASPAPGYLFLGWSGDVVAKSARVNFWISGQTTVKAEFVRNFFPFSAGSFVGEVGDSRGLIRFKLSSTGAFTGRVFLDGKTYCFSGVFRPDRIANVEATSEGQPNLKIQLKLLVGSGVATVKGTIVNGAETLEYQSGHLATSKVPQAGSYTFKATSPEFAEVLAAELVIGSTGTVMINGSLLDSIPWSAGGYLGIDGTLYIYSRVADGSLIVGDLRFDDSPERNMSGTLLWQRPDLPSVLLEVEGALNP